MNKIIKYRNPVSFIKNPSSLVYQISSSGVRFFVLQHVHVISQFVLAEAAEGKESLGAPVAEEFLLFVMHRPRVDKQFLRTFVLGGTRTAFEHFLRRVADLK